MILLLLAVAGATVPDKFGVGCHWLGAGGGGVSLIGDGSSALVNPAGLSRVRRPTAAVGLMAGLHRFEPAPDVYSDTNRDGALDDRDEPHPVDVQVDPAIGMSLLMARQVGGKFGLGFAVAAIGLGTVFGGIGCGLFGHKGGLDIALVGTIITAAASVPLAAAQAQEDEERRELIRLMRQERGLV